MLSNTLRQGLPKRSYRFHSLSFPSSLSSSSSIPNSNRPNHPPVTSSLCTNHHHHPNNVTTTLRRQFSSSSPSPPFYGIPRPIKSTPYQPGYDISTIKGRLMLAIQSAGTALSDPTRADAVAALGEVTGHVALRDMYDTMMKDETGQRILSDRPVVDSKGLIAVQQASVGREGGSGGMTFGQAYAKFMEKHAFDPDERDDIKYIEDPELAYVMLRYRQTHDFAHTLFELPPTVLGELALKWVELIQTNLPLTALSVTFGPLQLTSKERHVLRTVYMPWAIRVGKQSKKSLMNVYYEEEFDKDLDLLREELGVEVAPSVDALL